MRRLAIGAVACALAAAVACSTVDLGDPPADVNACRPSQKFFTDQIYPNYLDASYGGKKCTDSNCHGKPGQLQLMISPTSSPMPAIPLATGSDWEMAYLSATQYMNCNDVLGSALYTFPSGQSMHQGGTLFAPGGPELLLLEMWVSP